MKIAYRIALLLVLIVESCTVRTDESPFSDDQPVVDRDILEDIEMIYSDSAVTQFIIESPLLWKYQDNKATIEEFPQGFSIRFYDHNKEVSSRLSSRYAYRNSADGYLELRDSVIYTNNTGDVLETSALVIDEVHQTINTSRYFRLIRSSTQDTFYGLGFEASTDFKKMEIKKYVGKRQPVNVGSR